MPTTNTSATTTKGLAVTDLKSSIATAAAHTDTALDATAAAVNDPARIPDERLAALGDYLASNPAFPNWAIESNNHIHTCYSFSPYTPAGAALRARQAGLRVIGSVDHDSIAAAAEMRAACGLLGMGAVTGFEVRAYLHEGNEGPFADRKINNPDSPGVAYLTVQGIPTWGRERADQWLRPIREARRARTLAMAERANQILVGLGLAPFDPEADMMARSQYADGGTVTERHLLAAMAEALIGGFGRGEALVAGLEGMGMTFAPAVRAQLADVGNPHLTYDLLGVMKAEYLDRIYIQPSAELPTAREVVALAAEIGAIATYAYLGDVTASPTGDKKAEKFEDDYLDELFDEIGKIGFPAVTYMPPRNTDEQLARIHELASSHGLLEISGVDINQPRQSFACPELRRPEFASLNDATWALVAHEVLSDSDPSLALLPAGRATTQQLDARIAAYAPLGRALADGAALDDVIAEARS